ncbi:MAG: hypothetical protein ACKVQU_16095 [Burkholderiales bacterium]
MRRRLPPVARCIAAAVLFTTLSAPGIAAEFPVKSVRIVVPFPPGSGTDVITRLVTDHASNPKLYSKLPYDTGRDFQPVSQVGASPMLMLVEPSPGC